MARGVAVRAARSKAPSGGTRWHIRYANEAVTRLVEASSTASAAQRTDERKRAVAEWGAKTLAERAAFCPSSPLPLGTWTM